MDDKLQIVYKKLSEIKAYENNPRKNSKAVQPVINSIEEFGFKVPMVIENDGTIVTGHTRFEAAKELGLEEVPCIIADDLSETQIRAFRLADNKTSEFASWDWAKLENELMALDDIDMSVFGFDDGFDIDIDDLFQDKDEEEGDEKDEEPKTIICPNCGEVIEL